MTLTGADWESDVLGTYLSFVSANTDHAENTSCTGLAGGSVVRVMCAAVRIAAPTGENQTYAGIYDASDADQQVDMKTTPGLGHTRTVATVSGGGSTASSAPPFEMADNVLRMVCLRQTEATLDISIDGSAFNVQAETLTGIWTGIDTVSQGRQARATPQQYADAHIYALWIYTVNKTDLQIAAIFNSGDPWPQIEADPSSGPPPVLQRGSQTKIRGVVN